MWLTNSSIGRKLIIAITGVCLVLFVTFHCLMNGVAIFWPEAYNMICEFLGANWYALVASVGLAVLFIIHIIYALWLTLQNRKARGNSRYAVVSKPKQVEWASQNMLVLGIVVLAFLVVHLIQFWAKMQLAEIMGEHACGIDPANGNAFIYLAFSKWYTPVIYIIGFIALWFHMTHGFWSMFQTAGWNNGIWMKRLKTIGNWWTSLVVLFFIAQALVFTARAHCPECIAQMEGCVIEVVECESECGDAVVCDNACEKPACANTVCEKSECGDTPCAEKACDKAQCAQDGCTKENCGNECGQQPCGSCANNNNNQ